MSPICWVTVFCDVLEIDLVDIFYASEKEQENFASIVFTWDFFGIQTALGHVSQYKKKCTEVLCARQPQVIEGFCVLQILPEYVMRVEVTSWNTLYVWMPFWNCRNHIVF